MRIKILRIIILVLFVVLALDLLYVQVLNGQYYYNLSANNRIRVLALQARRGFILDRNNVILADNRLAFDVAVIPQDILEEKELFRFLSSVLDIREDRLWRNYHRRRVTPFAPVIVAEDVDKRVAMILEENKFRFPGLHIEENYRRTYPMGDIGAHVLGYVGRISHSRIKKLKDYGYTPQSIVGYTGVEEYYDSYLNGKSGGLQIEVDSRGRQVRLLSRKEPEPGEDIQLTIDAKIQQAAYEILGDTVGSIIVMDLDTGEILAMVSAPSYNPNIFTDVHLGDDKPMLFTDPQSPMLNRSIKGQYPPGSVFKVVVALAGLDMNQITADTTFFCKGYYALGRRHFRCLHVHGDQNLIEGIAHSCNVYFYNVGKLVGPDAMGKYARALGLGQKTQVDLPFEEKGYIPGRKRFYSDQDRIWYQGDTLNFAIGQGDVLVTPIQILRMISTVARRGKEVQPHLIRKIGSQEIVRFSTVRNVHIEPKVFDIVQRGLREAVTDGAGTARLLDMDGFRISGKTGTAQTSGGRRTHAWFAGYNTLGKRKIAFCVFLEHGGSSYYAVHMSRELLQRMKRENFF